MIGTGILKGMAVTARNFVGSYFEKERLITVQYPEERNPLPENYRNFPFLIYDVILKNRVETLRHRLSRASLSYPEFRRHTIRFQAVVQPFGPANMAAAAVVPRFKVVLMSVTQERPVFEIIWHGVLWRASIGLSRYHS